MKLAKLSFFFLLISFTLLTLVSAVAIHNPNLPLVKPPINYSLIPTVNNSIFLNGFPSSYFYPMSNPFSFINNSQILTVKQFNYGKPAGSSNAWTVSISGITEYTDNLMVVLTPTYTSNSATTLNINGLGAKKVYYGSTFMSSYFTAGYTYMFVYDSTKDSGNGAWTGIHSYDADTNSYMLRWVQVIKANSSIVANNIIVGNSTGYFHLKNGSAFDTSLPILWGVSAITGGSTGTNNYLIYYSTIATTQAITLTTYAPVYIQGNLQGQFFRPVSITPLTQTIPTTEDGYDYMLLGYAYSTTSMYLLPSHEIYAFENGKFQIKSKDLSQYAKNNTSQTFRNLSLDGIVFQNNSGISTMKFTNRSFVNSDRTPDSIDLGGTYSNQMGNTSNSKIFIHKNDVNAYMFGIGANSQGRQEYTTSGSTTFWHEFYINNVMKMQVQNDKVVVNATLNVTDNIYSRNVYIDSVSATGYSYLSGFDTDGFYSYGDVYVDGKIESNGGYDPPYVSYTMETRDTIVKRVRQEITESTKDNMVHFFNSDLNRYEDLKPETCEFFTEGISIISWDDKFPKFFKKEMQLIYTHNDGLPCYNTNSKTRYIYDRINNKTKQITMPIYANELPKDKQVNQTTGVIETKPIQTPKADTTCNVFAGEKC